MRQLRRMCATIVLVLVITTLSFADEGIIHTGYAPTPTPTPITATGGIIHTGMATRGEQPKSEGETLSAATEIALSLVQSLLAMF